MFVCAYCVYYCIDHLVTMHVWLARCILYADTKLFARCLTTGIVFRSRRHSYVLSQIKSPLYEVFLSQLQFVYNDL